MKRLAIITTHPIQYNAPLFVVLQQRGNIALKVFYTWGETALQSKYDPGFNKQVEWDIPLLKGYRYEFLENIAKKKGSHHYNGIINPDIIEKISQWQPDALLVFGWKFSSHLKVMRHFKNKIPVWFRGDSVLLSEKRGIKSIFKRPLLKWIYKRTDLAFYTGVNNKRYFIKYGVQPFQLVQACHSVDNERFFCRDEYMSTAIAWKDCLRIAPADFVFLYAGKLEPTKNVQSLLSAFAAIGKDNVHLIIAGSGPLEARLKNEYAGKNIHFIDFQNQQTMPVVYQLCDVFVLPSTGETWGLGINEAMAAGKAILASDKCGGAADLVREGENGFIFKAGDIPDLISKLKWFSESPDRVLDMQRKSFEIIQQFTFQQFVTAIESCLAHGKNN